MLSRPRLFVVRASAVAAAALAVSLHPMKAVESASSLAGASFFEQKIRPVLADHCYKCHSMKATKLKGGLASLGRDHFASAWSVALFGCGVKAGAVFGKTDKLGKKVEEGEVNEGRLFATILRAVGINHEKEYHVGARPIPLVNPGIKPIAEVLG